MKVLGKRIPLSLVTVAAVVALMIGVYAPGYVWTVNWKVDQLTSFEVCVIKLPGDVAGDFLLACQHVQPQPEPPVGVLIGERVVVHRLVWPLTPPVMVGDLAVVPPTLVPPEEMLMLAQEVRGKVEVLDELQAEDVERATLAGFKELQMPAALLAVIPPPGVLLPPQRYHEFIRVDRRLAITFSIPEADRIAAAQAWVQLLFGFYIFDCATGRPVPVPPFGGNYVQARVVNRDQQPDPMGSVTIVLSPGLYCVNKMIWGETKPVLGAVSGSLTVVVTARPA